MKKLTRIVVIVALIILGYYLGGQILSMVYHTLVIGYHAVIAIVLIVAGVALYLRWRKYDNEKVS